MNAAGVEGENRKEKMENAGLGSRVLLSAGELDRFGAEGNSGSGFGAGGLESCYSADSADVALAAVSQHLGRI
jgi:hypothetical protein